MMGQHKHNPTAIAAKDGKLKPKEKPKLSKRQSDFAMMKLIEATMRRRYGIAPTTHYDW